MTVDDTTQTWAPIIDFGNPTLAPDYPLDMPFVITYKIKTNRLRTSETLQYDNQIRAYPNPANNEFRISIPKEVTVKNIEIYDASGRLVKTFVSADSDSISDLKAGIYSVKVNINDALK